ncbi:MAG: type II secretion system protein GspJ [bacterium]
MTSDRCPVTSFVSHRSPVTDHRSPCSGVTLIELLLALVIASLVVAIVFSIYRTTSRAVQGQQERAQGAPAAARALEQLRADLTSSFFPAEDDGCAFSISETNGSTTLSFCSLQLAEGEADPKWSRAMHIEYRIEAASQLVRVVTASVGPGSVDGSGTNVLLGNLDTFRVEAYDGADWLDTWPGETAEAQPHAVRVELASARFKGKTSWQSEFFIPGALVVTSSVVRVSQK